MPALRLFGRKWLIGSDDLVFPGLFEIAFRILWLSLIIVVHVKYYHLTWECSKGGVYVRAYLLGMMAILSAILLIMVAIVNRSAQGAVTDEKARRHVPALLISKLILLIPETIVNVCGTIWAFCRDVVVCPEEHFVKTVIETLVVFNWVLFGLAFFAVVLIYDPLGSRKYNQEIQESARGTIDSQNGESMKQHKVTSLWQRRFRWAFCWVRSDEHGREAFQQVAALLATLFRGTDLVPTDVLAGCVLLRVKQKRETQEMRRIYLLHDDPPKYSSDINRVFAVAPRWMNLKDALHFLNLSIAAYGWPFVLYQHCATGICRLLRLVTCCACIRPNRTTNVTDDNCCLCGLAGVRSTSKLPEDDILFVSFRNHVFELPFCVVADHKTRNIVVAIRGSLSLRDIFTDLTASSERFEAEGLPPDTMAHKGMIIGADYVLARLAEAEILERGFQNYPDYGLVLTGHSLGAGVAVLMAFRLRPKYCDLKVYAFSTPAGLISREAARVTESFVFTVGVGDDCIMRLGVDSIENFRTGIIQVLHASRLPKYRILLNGFGYALFGVPSRDLESTWRDETLNSAPSRSPLLGYQFIPTVAASTEAALLSSNVSVRRFSKIRLFTAGRILHIVRKKVKSENKKASKKGNPTYEMRWATAEDFTELKVMPRMLTDHFPDNVYDVIEAVIKAQKAEPKEIS